VVKILDLGLARLRQTAEGELTACIRDEKASSLTPVGSVMMGTADYLAPEQAMDFHKADIRSDIYSLGCTLFYLLTGQPPFPGGSLAQKVAKHLQAEPPAVTEVRPDVPHELSGVLRRMLAKRPEDRYQTPAEVAEALAPFADIKGQSNRAIPAIAPRGTFRRWHRLLVGAVLLTIVGIVGLVGFPVSTSTEDTAVKETAGAAATEPEVDNLKQYRGLVWAVAFSPDGQLLATGSSDGIVRLWDTATGQKRQTLEGHRSGITFVGFGPDGTMLVSGSSNRAPPIRVDGTIKVWHLPTKTERTITEKKMVSLTLSPDGGTVALSVPSGGSHSKVRLVNVSSAQQWELAGGEHKDRTFSLAFSPNGKMLASGSESHDSTIKLWDTATRKEIRTLTGHDRTVRGLAFSPNGKILASASADDTVRLWDVSSGREQRVLRGHNRTVHVVAFAPPDGRVLASGGEDGTVILWDATTGDKRSHLKGRHSGPILALAYSPNGKLLVTTSEDRTVKLDAVAELK
jgi:DNA-binding beta-propeller fold protein YncE